MKLVLFVFLMLESLVFAYEFPSFEDLEVAKTIAMEACGEGVEGMIAIANVIRNRMKAGNTTAYEVVSAPNQFVGFVHKNREKRYKECDKEALEVTKNLMSFPDLTNGALYFKRLEEQRRPWHRVKTAMIGAHEFWK